MSLNNNKRFNKMDDLIRCEDALPSIDIVRCKDCIYWDTDWTPTRADLGEYWCPMTDMIKPGDWFCADGERKVDNKSIERSRR